jgi:hypothetical protein
MLSLSGIFKEVVPRFLHPHSFQVSVNKVLRKQVVNGDTQIFGGGHLVGEALIKIQIGVIKAVEHYFSHTTIQIGQIAHHPGYRINLAPDRNLHHVVVAMTMGIAALAVDLTVLLLAISLGVEAMRGAKTVSPGQIGPHASP